MGASVARKMPHSTYLTLTRLLQTSMDGGGVGTPIRCYNFVNNDNGLVLHLALQEISPVVWGDGWLNLCTYLFNVVCRPTRPQNIKTDHKDPDADH